MKEIVKYHNDFNKLRIPSFSELEQNILFGMLVKIKNNNKCEFSANELRKFISDKNPTNAELFNYVIKLKDNFFKADFTEIREIDGAEGEIITYNLFKTFKIFYVKKNNGTKNLTGIELEINEIFAYLINELTANFTRFELAEFIALSGKYTKTLYRLLKQYRHTGFMRMEWEEFVQILDIPYTRQIDIDQRILKPAIKELTKPRNLFDIVRVPFKGLTYAKIKDKSGRGRGGKVVAIEFRFTESQESKKDDSCFDPQYKDEIKSIKGKFFDFTAPNGRIFMHISSVTFADNKIIIKFYDADTKKSTNMSFSKDDFEKQIKPFIVDNF